jgi:hypothetical protein
LRGEPLGQAGTRFVGAAVQLRLRAHGVAVPGRAGGSYTPAPHIEVEDGA